MRKIFSVFGPKFIYDVNGEAQIKTHFKSKVGTM